MNFLQLGGWRVVTIRGWLWCFLMLMCAVAAPSQGDALNFGDNAGPPIAGSGSGLSATQGGEGEFLPVEDAYQLLPSRQGDTLVLEWVIAPGYYLYRDRFAATLTASGEALAQQFPAGVIKYDDYYEKDVEVYYDSVRVTATLPAGSGGAVRVESQGCADAGLCYPPRTLFVDLDSGATGALDVTATAPPGSSAGPVAGGRAGSETLPVMLAFAVLGGLLLNLMPCVFPVLSIKVISLSQGHHSGHRRHLHGAAYGLGVVASFLVIAVVLLALRAGGEALGWGFQLQSPGFITTLIFLFFAMGLGFSGFINTGARLMNLGQAASAGAGLRHSFLTGVLATVVASPCSAPFMGTALGFALTQSAATALLVFAALGAGMALPFVALTWLPRLLDHLPKPGPWMESLKQLLAFPLYLTAVWLLWILGNQTSSTVTAAVLCGLVLMVLAIWLWGHRPPAARLTAVVTLAAALLLPVRALQSLDSDSRIWQPYSPATLSELLAQRQAVFINLTADWCITCLANEKLALSSEAFERTLAAENITYLKGDWTNYDEDITRLLDTHGRGGVPLYLFYPAGQQTPIILPQILSKSTVLATLTQDSRK